MARETTPLAPLCGRCGGSAGDDGVVVFHSRFDPLQVTECGRCGSVLEIGGHRW